MNEKRTPIYLPVIIIVMAVVLVFSFVKINSMQTQYDQISNTLSRYQNEISSLRTEISAIYANVDEALKKEASMLSGVDFSVGELTAEHTAAVLTLSVVPKVITEDMTVMVSIGEQTTDLVQNGNVFAGTMTVGLFAKYDTHPLLTIKTDAETKTEYLEGVNVSYLFTKFLPSLHASMSGGSMHANGKLRVDLRFSVDCKPANPAVRFTSFVLVEEVNGEEIGREDITEAVKQEESYTATYAKDFDVAAGDTLKVYVLAEDSLGYIHKTLAHSWFGNDEGAFAEVALDDERIYDKNGQLLYERAYRQID